MLNQVLLEILACSPPIAKGPGAPTPPKQANPIELKRALAAIATRRKNLNAALAKLNQMAPGTQAHQCQQMRVQTAVAWLNFTTQRWKMMSEFSKKNGKKHPDTDKLTAFGDVHAGHAEKHAAIAHTNEPHPPLADIEFNHEKGHLVHAGTEHPFEIPHDPHAEVKHPGHAPGAPKAPESEPEPEAEKPLSSWHQTNPATQGEIQQAAEKLVKSKQPGQPIGGEEIAAFKQHVADKFGVELQHSGAEDLVHAAWKAHKATTKKAPEPEASEKEKAHPAIADAGLESLTPEQQKNVIGYGKNWADALAPKDFDAHGKPAVASSTHFADALKMLHNIDISPGAAHSVLAHFAKPPAPTMPHVSKISQLHPMVVSDLEKFTSKLANPSSDDKHQLAQVQKYAAGIGYHIDAGLAGTFLAAAAYDAKKKAQAGAEPAEAPAAVGPKALGDYNPDSQDKIADIVNNVVMGAGGHAGLGVQGKYAAAKAEIGKQLAKAGLPLHPGDLEHELHAAMKASKVAAPQGVDSPGESGDHPWALSDYTPKEKSKIAGIAKDIAKDAVQSDPVHHALGSKEPSQDTVTKFKQALDKAGVPLKHADAHAQLAAAIQSQLGTSAPPPPAPPPPPGPTAKLSPEQHEQLKEKVKEHLLKHAGEPSHGMLPSHAKQLLKDVGVDNASHEVHAVPHDIANEHLKELNKLTPDEIAQAGAIADDWVSDPGFAEGVAKHPHVLVSQLQDYVAKKTGKILTNTAALDIYNSALKKKEGTPKPFHELPPDEQQEVHQSAKKLAVSYATLGKDFNEFKAGLKQLAEQSGKPLSHSGLDAIASHAWSNYTHQDWNKLSNNEKDMLKAIAKKAFTSKGDLISAIAHSGIAHLSPAGFKGLADAVAEDKDAEPEQEEKPAPSLGALKSQVFTYWDQRVAKETPDEWTFIPGAAEEVVKPALVDHKPFSALYGQHQNSWLHSIWAEWHEHAKAADKVGPPPGPAEPAPHPTPAGPPPPPALSSPTHFTHTKFKKLGDHSHFTPQQKDYLDHKIADALAGGAHQTMSGVTSEHKLAGVAKKIHGEFKNDWAAAGVTGLSLDLVKKLVKEAAEKPHAPEAVAPAPASKEPAAAQPDDYMAMIKAAPAGTLNGEHHAAFVDIVQKVFIQKKWGGNFASPKQKNFFESMLKKVKAALPAAPGAPPPKVEPEPTPAPEPEITSETPSANPIGMGYKELEGFLKPTKPEKGPTPPPLTHPGWMDQSTFAGGMDIGAHPKQFLATDENFNPTGKTIPQGATHTWMFKQDTSAPWIAHAEVAANRVQRVLGIPTSPHIWVQESEENGQVGIMQHFGFNKSFRQLGMNRPWEQAQHKDKVAQQLQLSEVTNWLMAEFDSHNGNFVLHDNGDVEPIDHGQAGKFFDSSLTPKDTLTWQVPKHFKTGAKPFQDPEKGLAGRMLKEWAAGDDVPLMPLTDPRFESVVARAESIPSDLYKKLWQPYAEGMAKQFGHVAPYSKTASDRTPEGFLNAMDERRKKVRADIGDLYAHLAKTRAASLKAQGDERPISTIESEVRDQLGLDDFLQGKPVTTQADKKIVAQGVEKKSEAAPGWDFAQLPKSSHVPHHEALAKMGHKGLDMSIGGSDVKDNRGQFIQLGNNALAIFMLEGPARSKLEARLPDMDSANAPKMPQPPIVAPFVEPPKPTFKTTADDFHQEFLKSGGETGDKYKTLPDGTQVKLTKLEKHLDKFKKGTADESANTYFQKALDKANEMAVSADPVENAAGSHYVAELSRIGNVSGSSWSGFKNGAEVPESERDIKPFTPSAAHLAAQKKAKADVEGAHAKAVEAAKAKYEENKTKAAADYQKKLDAYAKEKADYDAANASSNKLPATKLDYYPVPAGVEHESAMGGANKISLKSKWDGAYGKAFDYSPGDEPPQYHEGSSTNPMHSYEIDFTDVVTGTAIAGKGLPPTKRLIVHYVPSPSKHPGGEDKKYPARGGMMRIQFPEGSTQAQMTEYMQKVNHALGVDVRPATDKEHELNYLRRMAWLRGIEGLNSPVNVSQEPEGSVHDKIEWWIEHFKKPPEKGVKGWDRRGLGYDPRYDVERTASGAIKKVGGQPVYKKNADGSKKPNPFYQPIADDTGGGRNGFRRFDITDDEMKKIMDKGLTLLKKSAPQYLEQMINGGAIYSTEKRAQVGMGGYTPSTPTEEAASAAAGLVKGTKSPADDVRSGGANECFFYKRPNGPNGTGWGHFDPRMMLYTPAWGHPTDSFGKKVNYNGYPGHAENKGASVQEAKLREMAEYADDSAEILLGDKVDFWKWIARINAPTTAKRDAWIKKLKDAGITHAGVDKKPIEEIIQLGDKSSYDYD